MLSCPMIWYEFFESYYESEINKIAVDYLAGIKTPLKVDVLKDLAIFAEGKLMQELLDYPEMVISHAEDGLTRTHNIHGVELKTSVRFYNIPKFRVILVRDLRSNYVSRFIGVEGLVKKTTTIAPFMVKAAYRCSACGDITKVDVAFHPKSKPRPPHECRHCRTKSRLYLEHSECVYEDSQIITVQDYPENLRGGEEPRSVDVFLRGDLTGVVNPGDRVIVNGILSILSQQEALSRIYVEANSVEALEKEYEEIEISEDEKQKILEMSKDPKIAERIRNSISPSIYGYNIIKEAISLQLFGGVPKELPDGTKKRGDIHILLVGDPGIAKSAMLRWVRNVAPRAVYTTGKGSSSVGLTAAVTRDEISKKFTLEAGALVLADKGLAIVDEIDKMSKEDRSALHEALEQQTVSIAKAGINAILRSRCSLLSAANPQYGRFDRYTPLVDQINLEPTLLSRFDLIFVIIDEPEEEKDGMMADHILSTHMGVGVSQPIEPEMLKKYIAYSRKYIKPVVSEEAAEIIKEYYVGMRKRVSGEGPIPITPRQLEALVRLAEASARMRLSNKVEEEDARRAISLLESSLKDVALDTETGEIDIDFIHGMPKSMRDKILLIKKIVHELDTNFKRGVPEDQILQEAAGHGIDEDRALRILEKLRENGELYCPKPKHYRLVVD